MYDRELLYADVDAIVPQLEMELEPRISAPPPALPMPPTPRSLDVLVAWARDAQVASEARHASAVELHTCIERIHASTCVGLANLQSHTDGIKSAVNKLEEIASRELASMEDLLKRHELDLYVLSRIVIHPKLLGKAPEESETRQRTLGDYVSATKMRMVADVCGKELEQLQERYAATLQTEFHLSVDLADLVSEVEQTHLGPSTETLAQIQGAYPRLLDAVHKIEAQCLPDDNGWPVADKLSADDVAQLNTMAKGVSDDEATIVQSLDCLTSDRNELVHRHLNLVQDISSLQSDYAELGAALAEIDAAFSSPKLDGFKHLTRLKKMLWAYGASLIDGVRRSEFTRLFMDKAQRLAELMAQFSEAELVRRKEHAVHVMAQLPWEVVIDTHPPALDISTKRRETRSTHTFDREDITNFFQQLDALDAEISDADPSRSWSPVSEVRYELQQLADRLDHAQDTFTTIARRELQLDDDDVTEDGSEKSGAPPSPHRSQRDDEALRRQLVLAHERTQRLEAELARRTAEWSDERQALQLAADTAQSRLEASVRSDLAQSINDPVAAQLARLGERMRTLQVNGDAKDVERLRTDLANAQAQLGQRSNLWQDVRPLVARTKALQAYTRAPDALNLADLPQEVDDAELGEAETLAALRTLDAPQFYTEMYSRLEWLVAYARRWQKSSRSTQEKYNVLAAAAREKLSVAHFAPGCLALFLPTRSSSTHWAAFNVGDPNYYVRPTDSLAQYMAKHEWLVARITSVETCIAQPGNECVSAGTTYYLLDIEGYEDPAALLRSPGPVRRVSDPFHGAARTSRSSSLGGSAAPWQPRADAPQLALTVDGSAQKLATPRVPSTATQALTRIQRASSSVAP